MTGNAESLFPPLRAANDSMVRLKVPKIARYSFACLLCLLFFCDRLFAAAKPLVSDLDAVAEHAPPKARDAVLPDYDPCETTAYGERVYFEENTSMFLRVENVEDEYQRARMAFLFGNYEYAYKVWEPLAYQGYAKAQATLAWMFHTGKGVNKNMQRALVWYRLAADNNHPIAQNNLGVFYEQGLEVGRNYQTAASWYQKAAEVGYPYAQYNLGVLYLEGNGVQKNKDEAIYWLQIASLQGVKQAGQILETLGQKSAPRDEAHRPKSAEPKKRYHGAPLPARTPAGSKDAAWIALQNPEHYTLHLAGSYDLPSLMVVASYVVNQSDVAYYVVDIRDKNWFTLIYGSYETEQLAQKALRDLPGDVKKWSPLVRKFAEVQESLNSRQ